MFKSTPLFALLSFASLASVVSCHFVNPPITSPAAGDVWTIGSIQHITWYVFEASTVLNRLMTLIHRDTTVIPKYEANQTASLILAPQDDVANCKSPMTQIRRNIEYLYPLQFPLLRLVFLLGSALLILKSQILLQPTIMLSSVCTMLLLKE